MSKKMFFLSGRLLCAALLMMGMLCFAGCRGGSASVQGAQDEKLVQIISTVEASDQENARAYLTHVESQKNYTATYVPEIRSFCFLLEENGLYQVNLTSADTQTQPRFMEISDDESYYVLYISVSE